MYARTSSASQRFGYSIEEQVRQCLERCEMLDWEVAFIFRDEAKSGKDTDRAKFQEMIDRAEGGAFDVLVFWKLDRFSRSIMHAVQLEKRFRDLGVGLHSITEQIDTTTAAGRFNFRNIANAAEFERDLIKQRTKMGHRALAMEHKWPNDTPPLGFERMEDGRLSVHPAEAGFVRWILKRYLEVRSMPALARELNDNGRTTANGKDWTASRVGKILRHELYLGEYSVGEINESVPEYQILSSDLFSQVTATRERFQRSEPAERPAMDSDRKREIVDTVVERFTQNPPTDFE